MVKGKIHWKQQTQIPGTYQQHAWTDTSEFTVPFTLSAADNRSRAELQTAISNAIYAKSSFRTYGTSYRLQEIDWEKNIARVQASTSIGD
jgi:hypothetical protein